MSMKLAANGAHPTSIGGVQPPSGRSPLIDTGSSSQPMARVQRPLSESALWLGQHAFYESAGPRAWTESGGAIPSYATSNAFLADRYVRALLAISVVVNYLLPAWNSVQVVLSLPSYWSRPGLNDVWTMVVTLIHFFM